MMFDGETIVIFTIQDKEKLKEEKKVLQVG